MSFRPTIAVFANGRIADVGYYKNWHEKALFCEALTIGLLYSDCASPEEFRERKFGRQQVFYSLSPEVFENTDEDLSFLLSCSEFPVAVDLTAGCVYLSETPLSEEAVSALPSALDPEERRRLLNASESLAHSAFEHAPCVPSEKHGSLEEMSSVERVGDLDAQIDYYYELLKHFRIPFRELDRGKVLALLREWEEVGRYLSRDTYEALMRTGEGGA